MPKVGFKHSEETKRKLKITRARQIITKQHRVNISKSLKGHPGWNKGIIPPSAFKKGHIPWNKGKKGLPCGFKKGYKMPQETIKKISSTKRGIPWTDARKKAQLNVRVKSREHKKPTIMNGKEYSPMWKELRKIVYRYDNWVCQECGVHCHNKQLIQCHHIDYDITNNDLSNLITLCRSCHMKTNYRRENWIIHYKNKRGEFLQ